MTFDLLEKGGAARRRLHRLCNEADVIEAQVRVEVPPRFRDHRDVESHWNHWIESHVLRYTIVGEAVS
jgi:hypothetical protein